MRYLCLGYYDPDAFSALSDEDQLAVAQECAPHDVELRQSGHLVSVASLEHGVHVALRPTGAGALAGTGTPASGTAEPATSVTDGPYAETKELVGSFFIVEAEDLDEAVRVASLHPAARVRPDLGFGVEVRPIGILGDVDGESGEMRLVQGSPSEAGGG